MKVDLPPEELREFARLWSRPEWNPEGKLYAMRQRIDPSGDDRIIESLALALADAMEEVRELRDQQMALLLVVDDSHRIMEERADKIDALQNELRSLRDGND